MTTLKSKGGILEKFDIFGTPITIRFNDMDVHKTLIGALATIIIVGVLSVEVFYVLVDLISYKNVSVIFQEEIVSVPNKFVMKPQTFQLAVGLLSDGLKYITDEEVFYFDAVFQQTDKIFNTTSNQYSFKTVETPFKMVKCTPEHFQMENIKEYFLSLPYQSLYCFDINTNLELQGQYGAQIYKRLRIKVKDCQGINCKSQEEKEKLLHDGQLQIFYVNYSLQITNVTQPFQEFGQSYFWKQSKNSLKNINVYFRNTYLESTEGIIAPEVKKYNKLFYSFDREQILSQIDNTFFELYINLEKNKESHYYRKYLTLTQAFSQIGGLFNFLLTIGALFFKPISQIIYKQKLINLIFSFRKKSFQNNGNNEKSPILSPETNFVSIEEEGCKNMVTQSNQLSTLNINKISNIKTRSAHTKSLKQSEILKLENQSPNNQQYYLKQQLESKLSNPQLIKQKSYKTENGVQSQQIQDYELNQSKKIKEFQLQQINQESQKIQNNLQFSLNDQVVGDQYPQQLSSQQIFNSTQQREKQKTRNIFKRYLVKDSQDKQNKSKENQLDKLFNRSENSFYITFTDIIKSNLSSTFTKFFNGWNMSTKSKMIQYGLQKLNQHLEINYIIDKLLELEKLKQLLLNSEQIRLFNLIPKPDINEIFFKNSDRTNQDLQKTHIFHAKNKNLEEKIIDAQDAFNQIIIDGKGEVSQINRKLLELLDPKLIVFLEQNSNVSKMLSQRQTLSYQNYQNDENKQQMTTNGNNTTERNQIFSEKNILSNDILMNLNVAEESTFNEEFKTPKPFISSPNNKFQLCMNLN